MVGRLWLLCSVIKPSFCMNQHGPMVTCRRSSLRVEQLWLRFYVCFIHAVILPSLLGLLLLASSLFLCIQFHVWQLVSGLLVSILRLKQAKSFRDMFLVHAAVKVI